MTTAPKNGKRIQGTRVLTHPDGITRVGTFTYEGKPASGAPDSLAPAGSTVFYEGPAIAVMLRRFPAQFTTGYHNDPAHQHQKILHLEGEAGGDCKDGSKFRIKPGDYASIEDPTGTGHTAYDAGGTGFTQIFVSVPGE